ncbi:hypothetical protein KDU71_10320 [Carboxylicivirga sediminis]|uniref:Uncharacterized protein n=1 Tax=Carboxylicivirga sediminis TaxID=2006564 RepID=A0A941F3Y4_9BACT|nr:hypothetical protein [Carboxylicivirga sediminis]MBR8535952.1 hypothetical protein [Carboxylicivirga sediminis]
MKPLTQTAKQAILAIEKFPVRALQNSLSVLIHPRSFGQSLLLSGGVGEYAKLPFSEKHALRVYAKIRFYKN